jgi:hypothetical protein
MASPKLDIAEASISASQLSELLKLAAQPGTHVNRESLQAYIERRNPFSEMPLAKFFSARKGITIYGDPASALKEEAIRAQPAGPLKGSDLSKGASEADMFGVSGSKKLQATIKQGAALAQVRAKLVAQWDGQALPDDPDSLLVDGGSVNLFPIPLDKTVVCVLDVRWVCSSWQANFLPLFPGRQWLDRLLTRNCRVFLNKIDS